MPRSRRPFRYDLKTMQHVQRTETISPLDLSGLITCDGSLTLICFQEIRYEEGRGRCEGGSHIDSLWPRLADRSGYPFALRRAGEEFNFRVTGEFTIHEQLSHRRSMARDGLQVFLGITIYRVSRETRSMHYGSGHGMPCCGLSCWEELCFLCWRRTDPCQCLIRVYRSRGCGRI